MEKEIVWTKTAQNDFWEITAYLDECWPPEVLENFTQTLHLKVQLIQKHPALGFRSKKYSRFRKTLVTKYYLLIYTVNRSHIVIHRVKHSSLK